MKNVRIMLTAVAIVAVIGGVLAFKAQKGVLNYCVRDGKLSTGFCTARFILSQQNGNDSYWTHTDDENCVSKLCNQPRIVLMPN